MEGRDNSSVRQGWRLRNKSVGAGADKTRLAKARLKRPEHQFAGEVVARNKLLVSRSQRHLDDVLVSRQNEWSRRSSNTRHPFIRPATFGNPLAERRRPFSAKSADMSFGYRRRGLIQHFR
jgi:hypothetical protein